MSGPGWCRRHPPHSLCACLSSSSSLVSLSVSRPTLLLQNVLIIQLPKSSPLSAKDNIYLLTTDDQWKPCCRKPCCSVVDCLALLAHRADYFDTDTTCCMGGKISIQPDNFKVERNSLYLNYRQNMFVISTFVVCMNAYNGKDKDKICMQEIVLLHSSICLN